MKEKIRACEKSSYKEFNFKDFGNLDQSEDIDYLIDSMGELFALDSIQNMKKRAIEKLSVKTGDKVLELGCGLGDDAETFGHLVGNSGKVIAIDSSRKMLERAKSLSKHTNVEYLVENALELPYLNESFDICHADRVLVSQIEPWRVLQESIRVLKPNGRVGITDCDFGSIIFYPYDSVVTPVLLNRMQEITQNPLIGRELHDQFEKHGLIDIMVSPEPYVVRSFEKLNTMIDIPRILNDLAVMKRVSEKDIQRQLSLFRDADLRGVFLYSITFFTVIGQKT